MSGARWASIEELREAELRYRQTWWRLDPHVADACRRRLGLAGALAAISLPRTVDAFRLAGQIYESDRQVIHDNIVADQIGAGAAPSKPTAYFTIGCMGAGKTTYLRKFVCAHRRVTGGYDDTSLSRVSADHVREALPGYGEGLGSRVVEPECYDVTYMRAFPAVRDAGFDLVYDTIGRIQADGTVSFQAQLLGLKDAGYRIHLLRADAPLFACIDRAETRALETGRLINADDQTAAYPEPAAVEAQLRSSGLLDGWISLDTFNSRSATPIIGASDEWRDLHGELEQIVFTDT